MKYSLPGQIDEEQIIYESAVVSQFLCDSFPSHLLPSPSSDPKAALARARINFFVDSWSSKLGSQQMGVMKADASEKEKLVDEWVATVKKEIEPFLSDAGPFFGGSKELTYTEVIIAPFLVRWYAYSQAGEFVPGSLAEKLDQLPSFGKWAKAVREHKSVLKIWNGEAFMEGFKRKYGKVMVPCK